MRLKIFSIMFLLVLTISMVSATCSVTYFYSDDCGYCKQVSPIIDDLMNKYSSWDWKLKEISIKENSDELKKYTNGVPTVVLSEDNVLTGAVDIPRWLPCELQQMSTYECKTYSSNNIIQGSWFIK